MNKILELKREAGDKLRQAEELNQKAIEEKRSLTEEEKTEMRTLMSEAKRLNEEAKTLEELASTRTEIGHQPAPVRNVPEAPAILPYGRQEEVEPGIRLARHVKSTLMGMREGRTLTEVAERMYPKDTVLHESIRAAMGTSAPSDGGVLVPENLSSEIIPLLRQTSVVRSLGARIIPLPNGNLNIPRQTGAATFSWIGQNQPIKASKVSLGMLKLSAKKLAGMIPLANELIKDSSIAADRFIRDELVTGIAESEDISCLYGKGTNDEPIGVLNAKGIKKAGMGALPDSDKLADIVGCVMSEKFPGGTQFGWMFSGVLWSLFYNLKDGVGNYIHRQEMDQNKLLGWPFKINNNITVGSDDHAMTEIYFGDWSQFIIGETLGLQIDVSKEATYMDGNQLVSAFANDQTVMRALMREDFGVRYGQAFVVRQKVHTK